MTATGSAIAENAEQARIAILRETRLRHEISTRRDSNRPGREVVTVLRPGLVLSRPPVSTRAAS